MKNKIGFNLTFLILILVPCFSKAQNTFEQIDISDKVDPSTGDLRYSLSLMSVPGAGRDFPISIRYTAGSKLEQESSWVGLNWSLDPGKIVRFVSEIPDDYNGYSIKTKMSDPGGEQTIEVPTYLEQLFKDVDAFGQSASDNFKKGVLTHNDHTIVKGMENLANAGQLLISPFLQPHVLTLYMNLASPRIKYNVSSWDWNIEENREKRKIWFLETGWDKSITYKWWLDVTREEKAYGILYQSNIPVTQVPSGASNYFNPNFIDPADNQDLNLYSFSIGETDNQRSFDKVNYASDYYQGASDSEIYKNTNPVFWAGDQYFVSAMDLSGEIQPLRFDNASLATSFSSNIFYDSRIALQKYKIAEPQTGKVQFAFLSNLSNRYTYHKDSFNGNYSLSYNAKPVSDRLNALHFNEQSKGLTSIKPADSTFNGNNEMYRGTSVKWFSTQEIIDHVAKADGFMDYHGLTRSVTNTSLIGGFMITDVSGYTYHFAIPVLTSTSQVANRGATSFQNYTDLPYASEWLITAITGPDFSDCGTVPGEIDDSDKGWYVTFEYGKYQNDFDERFPKDGVYSPSPDFSLVSHKVTDLYMLNAIKTNTHTALFVKGKRDDSYSQPETFSISSIDAKNPLALTEIILVKNSDADQIKALTNFKYLSGLPGYNGNQSQVLKKEDIYNNNAIRDLVNNNAIKRVILRYDHSLCQGIPTSKSGKLTLKGLDFMRREESSDIASFNFNYSFNPNYKKGCSDGWGFYKSNPIEGDNKYKVESSTEGAAWSLTGISTPSQGLILVDYERDKYSSVSGEALEVGTSEKWGGDLRVKSIKLIMRDGRVSSQFSYNYNKTLNSISSGVATLEPMLCKGLHRKLDDLYGYPSPTVTYEDITKSHVANDLDINSDYVLRYKFYIPAGNKTVKTDTLLNKYSKLTPDFSIGSEWNGYDIRQAAYEITYKQKKIGLPASIEKLDKNLNSIEKIEYQYEESDLGSFTQGLHLLDNTYRIYSKPPGPGNSLDKRMSYRFINCLTKYVPFRLRQVNTTSYKTGITSILTNTAFDFYSGEVLMKKTSDAYGNIFIQKTVPAYHHYDSMGLKVKGGKNMLLQQALNYYYKIDTVQNNARVDASQSNARLGLVSASAQTWSTQIPVLQKTLTVSDGNKIWRANASYSYMEGNSITLSENGLYNMPTGELPLFNAWSISDSEPLNWQKKGTITLCDDFSNILETKDISGNYAASLMDKRQTKLVATALNARYHEIRCSGAEYFSGNSDRDNQVHRGDGNPSTAHAHSGLYSLIVGTGEIGFNCTLSSQNADLNKKYKASVWVYAPGEAETQEDLNNLELYYTLNGKLIKSVHPIIQKSKSKSWYLLNLDINPNGNDEVAIAVKNNTQRGVYFDDFRLHPINATMTTYNYDPARGDLNFILDANNLYTKFEYDGLGRLMRTSKEMFNFDFGNGKESYHADVIVKETKYNYGNGK